MRTLKGFARLDWLERAIYFGLPVYIILKKFQQRTWAMVSTSAPRRMALAR
jgi:hypothetical protein